MWYKILPLEERIVLDAAVGDAVVPDAEPTADAPDGELADPATLDADPLLAAEIPPLDPGDDVFTLAPGESVLRFDLLELEANDPTPQPTDFLGIQQPQNGIIVEIIPGQVFEYRPNPGFVGVDSTFYEVIDLRIGEPFRYDIYFDVQGEMNMPPVANPDMAATDFNTPIEIDVLANDTDPEGDLISLIGAQEISDLGGVVLIDPADNVIYEPPPGIVGTDSFQYTIQDSEGNQATGTVTIDLTEPPLLNDPILDLNGPDAPGTDHNVTINGIDFVSLVDFDAEVFPAAAQQADRIELGLEASYASVLSEPDVQFQLHIPDIPLGVTLSFLTEVEPNVYQLNSDYTFGILNVRGVITFDSGFDPADIENFVKTIEINVTNPLTLEPRLEAEPLLVTLISRDASGIAIPGGILQSSLNIDVEANAAPIAMDDIFTLDEDTVGTINVLDNDSDPDMDNLSVALDPSLPSRFGSAMVNPDNTITYTPNPDFNGPDAFGYIVSDGNGGEDSALVNVTVNPVNDAAPFIVLDGSADNPLPANDGSDAVVIDLEQGVTATFLGNLTQSGTINTPTDLDDAIQNAIDAGINIPENEILFSDPDLVDLVVGPRAGADSQIQSVRIIHTNPMAGDTLTLLESTYLELEALPPTGGTAIEIALRALLLQQLELLSPDGDPETLFNTELVVSESTGLNGEQIYDISFIDSRDNSATTIPALDLRLNNIISRFYLDTNAPTGSRVFEVTATDSFGATSEVNTITINYFNAPPDAVDDMLTLDEDTVGTINVLDNDSDPDMDNLSVALDPSLPSRFGSAAVNPDNTITYTPNPDFNGPDAFGYIVSDGNGGEDSALVNVTVNPVNDAAPFIVLDGSADNPPASDGSDAVVIDLEQGVTATFLGNLTQSGTINTPTDLDDAIQNAIDAGINIPENEILFGDPDLVDLVVGPRAGADSQIQSVRIIHTNPMAGDTLTLLESTYLELPPAGGTALEIALRALLLQQLELLSPDGDHETLLNTELVVSESTGLNGEQIYDISFIDSRDNSATTIPAFDLLLNNIVSRFYLDTNAPTGSRVFEVTATDSFGATSEVNTITINYFNAPPDAVDDMLTLDEDTVGTINVLDNDSDPDMDELMASLVSGPANGVATLDAMGNLTYTPNANYNGPDQIVYEISDGELTDQATVNITVNPANDAPEASDDALALDEDTSASVNVLANDMDIDGDDLMASIISGPANGVATLDAMGNLTYTPNANYNGPDQIVYEISDGELTDQATVKITVNPVNDAPVGVDDALTVGAGLEGGGNVLDNDIDVDLPDDMLRVELVAGPMHGEVMLNEDGSYTYEHNASRNFADSFTYRVIDAEGATDEATVNITIEEQSEGPKLKLLGFDKRIYIENQGAKRLSPAVFVKDADSRDFDGGKLRVEISENGTLNDMLLIKEHRRLWVDDAGQIYFRGELIGQVDGGENGEALIVEFNANASAWDVARVISRVAYQNDSDNPDTAMREVTYTVTDGDGGISNEADKRIWFLDVNDDPEIVSENDSASAESGELIDIGQTLGIQLTDADLDEDGLVKVQLKVRRGNLNFSNVDDLETAVFSDELDADGMRKITFTANLDEANILLSRLTYQSRDYFTGTDYLWIKVNDLGGDGLLGGTGQDWERFEIYVS